MRGKKPAAHSTARHHTTAHSSKHASKKRSSKKWPFFAFGLVVAIAGAGGWYWLQQSKQSEPPQQTSQEVVIAQNIPEEPAKKGVLKEFSGEEFKQMYNNFAYPNTSYIAEDYRITGDQTADEAIRQAAEKRGYIRRSAPVQDTFREVEPSMLLQERAAQPWLDLKATAQKDGVNLFLTAAYRSADEQRRIFLERLGAAGQRPENFANPAFITTVDQILASTAIPGYSRHHTGYTIDIGCGNDPVTTFDYTVCFDWLSAENYKQVKTHGFIPSYPEGAGQQGPEPETWEYVWVGLDTVTE